MQGEEVGKIIQKQQILSLRDSLHNWPLHVKVDASSHKKSIIYQ